MAGWVIPKEIGRYKEKRLIVLNDILSSMPNQNDSIVDDKVWKKVLDKRADRMRDYINRMQRKRLQNG